MSPNSPNNDNEFDTVSDEYAVSIDDDDFGPDLSSEDDLVPPGTEANEFIGAPDGLVRRPSSSGAFTEKEAASRSGNFVLPIGLAGSGKTTFLAALFRYISENPSLKSNLHINSKNGMPNYGGQTMITEWEKLWRTGQFLDPTDVGDDAIREVEYHIEPTKGERTKLNLNLVEISGEDIKKVVPELDRNPTLPPAILAALANSRIQTVLVFIIHPARPENDELFESFITFLKNEIPDRIQTISLAILIANPILALARFKERNPDIKVHAQLSGKLCLSYLREFSPRTFAIFKTWNRSKRSLSPLYIGEIETFKDSRGGSFEKIVMYDDTHMKSIFAWLYKQFTGRTFGPTWFQRMIRAVKE